jgi:hypothetical protein
MTGEQSKRAQQDWHQQELGLHWHVNSDRIDIQLPSLVCNPTIAKDPKRTPATVSLSLTSRSCRKTSYRNYVLRLERKTRLRYYCILHRLCPILRCALGRHHCNQVKSFRQTKHTSCEKKAVERERNNTRKLTTVLIFECRLYSYSMCSVGY